MNIIKLRVVPLARWCVTCALEESHELKAKQQRVAADREMRALGAERTQKNYFILCKKALQEPFFMPVTLFARAAAIPANVACANVRMADVLGDCLFASPYAGPVLW